MKREMLKDWVSIVQGVATTLALFAAAFWFYIQQSTKPELRLDHVVMKRRVEGIPNAWLVSIEVNATNTGKIREHLSKGKCAILQVNPVPGRTILADQPLVDLQLDPGETDQAIFFTYVVSDHAKTIEVDTTYPSSEQSMWSSLPFMKHQKNYEWHHKSILDLADATVSGHS